VISLWLPVAIWMAAIYVGAGIPAPTLAPVVSVSDTFLHLMAYSGLALLTLRATARGRWAGVTSAALLLAFAIVIIHGATVEIEQLFMPTRTAEWRDLANDATGAALGLLPAWVWSKMKG
jgi:VanZ family protein